MNGPALVVLVAAAGAALGFPFFAKAGDAETATIARQAMIIFVMFSSLD
jgi:hypothetical protein